MLVKVQYLVRNRQMALFSFSLTFKRWLTELATLISLPSRCSRVHPCHGLIVAEFTSSPLDFGFDHIINFTLMDVKQTEALNALRGPP